MHSGSQKIRQGARKMELQAEVWSQRARQRGWRERTLPQCFWLSELFIVGDCDVSFDLGFLVPIGCFQCLLCILSLPKQNQLQIRFGTCQAQLLSTRHTQYVLMNKEWTSLMHTMFTHVQHMHTHVPFSHTVCQSCFSLTGRRKVEWEMQRFAGVELLAYVGLVGLSIHVQRQPLSDSLFDGWWAWVLRPEGFWHRVHLLMCACYYALPCSCVYCLFCVCDVAELWAFWGFQSSSTLLCDREGEAQSQTALRFYSGVEKRATKAAEPWKSLWLNCLQSRPRKPVTTSWLKLPQIFLKFK